MNKKIVWGIVGVIVLVAVFYGGVSYGKSQTSASPNAASAAYGGRTRGAGSFGGATIGQIIGKDATSITVQLMNMGAATTSTTPAGSKIVFVDSNTKISKQMDGTLSDLTIGTNVSVSGTPNADGSMSATAVQIRPAATGRPTQ
jgi:hypothetical protein